MAAYRNGSCNNVSNEKQHTELEAAGTWMGDTETDDDAAGTGTMRDNAYPE